MRVHFLNRLLAAGLVFQLGCLAPTATTVSHPMTGQSVGPTSVITPTPSPVTTAPPVSKLLLSLPQIPPTAMDLYNHLSQFKSGPFDGAMVLSAAVKEIFVGTLYSQTGVAPNWNAGSAMAQDALYFPKVHAESTLQNLLILRGGLQSGFDWFDDSVWNNFVLPNLAYVSALAKQNGFIGIALDPEAYSPRVPGFQYASQVGAGSRTFVQFEAQLRARGKSFASVIEQNFPGATIVLLGANSFASTTIRNIASGALATDLAVQSALQSEPIYSLLPAFTNGVIDGAAGATVIDANELSYYEYLPSEFLADAQRIRGAGQSMAAFIDQNLSGTSAGTLAGQRYSQQLSAGMATYVDGLNSISLKAPVAPLSSAQQRLNLIQNCVYQGITYASRLAWVYSETLDPVRFQYGASACAANDSVAGVASNQTCSGLLQAISQAKAQALSGIPLGFDVTPYFR